MGFLAQQAAGAFGFGTAAQAAGSAMKWDVAGTALNAAGSLFDGVGGMQQGLYQSQVAKNNAAIAEANAVAASDSGNFGAEVALANGDRTIGAQKAAFAANGIDVGSGSAQETIDSTARMSGLDAAMIQFNAAREAFGAMSQAQNFKTEASLTKAAGYGSLISGAGKSAATLVAGASSVGKKWAAYKTTGAY
jgi:hypothetical protein